MTRYRSRIPIVDLDNIQSWSRDDITGLPVMHNDMVKQMEYIGGKLAWRGFMVHYKDADEPNPQLIPPKLKPDPVPIKNPRFMQLRQLPPIPTGLSVVSSTDTSIVVQWDAVQLVNGYIVGWNNFFVPVGGESDVITDTTYTITDLSPQSTYNVYVASTRDNWGQSSFSNAIGATTH